jgi:hypothetical protein
MEKELEKLYNEAVSKINKKENKMEFLVFPGKYFKFMVRDRPIIVFSEDEKYAEFNEKYAEKANSMKEFSKLIEYLKRNDYKTNLN